MSKVDALRAMREAKYARAGAPPDPPGTTKPTSARSASAKPVSAKPVSKASARASKPVELLPDGAELCGHRSMGGKSCSRDAGHSEKNHRYASA